MPSTWPMLCNALQHMPSIAELGLRGSLDGGGPSWDLICRDLNIPTLSKLSLNFPALTNGLVHEHFKAESVARKSNITSLTMSDFERDSRIPERYLKWPKALENIVLETEFQDASFVE